MENLSVNQNTVESPFCRSILFSDLSRNSTGKT